MQLRLSGGASSPELQGLPLSPRGSQVALTACLATSAEMHHEMRAQATGSVTPSMGTRSGPSSTNAATLVQNKRRGMGVTTQCSGKRTLANGVSVTSSVTQQNSPRQQDSRQGRCQPWVVPRSTCAPPASLRHAANMVSQSISSRYGIVGSRSEGELAPWIRKVTRDESTHQPGAAYHQIGVQRHCFASSPLDVEQLQHTQHSNRGSNRLSTSAQCLSTRLGNNDFSSGSRLTGSSVPPSELESAELQIQHLEQQVQLLGQQMQEEAASHTTAQLELERQLDSAGKESRAHSARAERMAVELERASDEHAGLRAHLDCQVQEVHSMKAMMATMNNRLENLMTKHAALQKRHAQQEQDAIERESHADRRSKDLTSREQDLELHQQELEDREAELADIDEVAEELQQKTADFKSWKMKQEERLRRELQEFETPRGQREAERENRRLRDALQEQREGLFKAEGLLRQEQIAMNFPTPGEFIKMAKKHETETYAHSNADMKLRIFGLKHEVMEVQNFNEILRKHLSITALEAVETEIRLQLHDRTRSSSSGSSSMAVLLPVLAVVLLGSALQAAENAPLCIRGVERKFRMSP